MPSASRTDLSVGGRASQRLRRRIVAAGAVLVALLAGSAAYDTWRLHHQIMRASERELGNLAKALAEEASRSLQAVDLLLRDTAAWYGNAEPPPDADSLTAALASRALGVPQVSVLTLVDASGRQVARSRPTGEPLALVSDRPYFTQQRDGTAAELYINEPIVTRTERRPGLVLSRRLTDKQGKFAGVVTAIVTLEQLQGAYAAIDLGEGGALLLTLADGSLVVRQPTLQGYPLDARYPELAEMRGGKLIDRSVSPLDGRVKLVAAVGVGERPLILAMTRDEQQALRPWYDELTSTSIRTLVISLLVALAIAGLLRQLRRVEAGERALRESEQRYEMAMAAANEGHAEWKLDRDEVFTSERWRALHGLAGPQRSEPASALKQQIVVHEQDLPALQEGLRAHLAGHSPDLELAYRIRAPNGEWRWIHARGRCLRDGEGRPTRLFCAALDVSERKQAEADQAELASRLQQASKLEALGTLAGGIAHDFNNILGAILGFGEMAQRRTESGSVARRHIDRVLQSGARARLLVRGILDFSRSAVAEQSPVALQAVVEEALAMLAPSLPAGVALRSRLEAGGTTVMGDATQLHQVVMNLCANAAQAVGEQGSLDIGLAVVERTERGSALHGELPPGRCLRLDVADSGPGIPPEVLARIFDPFFTTRKVGGGTGLGLSVVHGIVMAMGGAIDVASVEPHGTRFTVWLPIAGEAVSPAPGATADWPTGAGQVVMVVDDESALVELAEELLAGLGYEPVGYPDAETALRAFGNDPGRFDLLLTDEMLPGMKGSELAARLRQRRPDLPVVLMSGNLADDAVAAAMKAGFQACLHKPLGLAELAAGVASALSAAPHAAAPSAPT